MQPVAMINTSEQLRYQRYCACTITDCSTIHCMTRKCAAHSIADCGIEVLCCDRAGSFVRLGRGRSPPSGGEECGDVLQKRVNFMDQELSRFAFIELFTEDDMDITTMRKLMKNVFKRDEAQYRNLQVHLSGNARALVCALPRTVLAAT